MERMKQRTRACDTKWLHQPVR